MSSRKLDEEAIFHVARGIDDLALRSTYLVQVCGGDGNLRSRVELLLEVHEQPRTPCAESAVSCSRATGLV